MNIQIEVREPQLIEKLSRENKPYFKQPAWLHTEEEPYPVQIMLFVKERDKMYPSGFYNVSTRAYVDRFKSLNFGFDLAAAK